jgi:hypothetical protein
MLGIPTYASSNFGAFVPARPMPDASTLRAAVSSDPRLSPRFGAAIQALTPQLPNLHVSPNAPRLFLGGAHNQVDASLIGYGVLSGLHNSVQFSGTAQADAQIVAGDALQATIDAGAGNDVTVLSGQNSTLHAHGGEGHDILVKDGRRSFYRIQQQGDTTYAFNRLTFNQVAYTGYEEVQYTGMPLWSSPSFRASIAPLMPPAPATPTRRPMPFPVPDFNALGAFRPHR